MMLTFLFLMPGADTFLTRFRISGANAATSAVLSAATAVKPLSQAELDALKLSTAEKGAVMDGLMAARQEVRDARDAASASLDELKATLDAAFEKVRALQPDAPKAVARFFAAVQELDAKLKQEQAKPTAPGPGQQKRQICHNHLQGINR